MTTTENTYEKLKAYLPKGYRIRISKKTGASVSTINMVLRGLMKDNKSIVLEAYRIADEEVKRIAKDAKELAMLRSKIAKNQ
jgi:hypothetical protein